MSTFPLRVPDALKEAAAEQAEQAGISLNQYIAVAVAGRVGAQAEAQRYIAARAARAVPGNARTILATAGVGNPPRDDDRIDSETIS